MLRALALAAFVVVALGESACAGCEGAPLSVVDAGPDDVEDAGAHVDAGEPFDSGVAPVDAGVVDSGPVGDAGPICDFPAPVAIPYACEGDEDYCDLGDVRHGALETNIYATWSYVDGEDLVMQFRFQALPFRGIADRLIIAFSRAQGAEDFDHWLCQGDDFPESNICIPGSTALFVDLDASNSYPPGEFGMDPNLATIDPCESRISLATPFLELRAPLQLFARTDGTVAYGFTSGDDVSWPLDAPSLIMSRGGSVDALPDDLVRMCDELCAGPP